jgi:hypothetical protein
MNPFEHVLRRVWRELAAGTSAADTRERVIAPAGVVMGRRAFLRVLAAGAAAAGVASAVDLERLVWTPGEVVSVGGLIEESSNIFLTPQWVTQDVARFWVNNVRLIGSFDRTFDVFDVDTPPARVKLPTRFLK